MRLDAKAFAADADTPCLSRAKPRQRVGPGGLVTYCLAGQDVEGSTCDAMARFLSSVHGIELVVEGRRRERRQHPRRKLGPVGGASRTILNQNGRRVAERRGRTVSAPCPPMPPLGDSRPFDFVHVEQASTLERMSIDSLRLVVQFQAGDATAFADLYALWAIPLLRFCERTLGNGHDAQDAVQRVAERLLDGKLRRYEIRPAVSFQAWLWQIARNHVTDELRRRGRLSLIEPDHLVSYLEQAQSDHVPSTIAQSQPTALEGALANVKLPERQRQVLELRFAFDLTHAEIARILDLAEGTVRQLQHRAIRTLKHRFRENDLLLGASQAV
jgi:RNA polymerase sigma-70 factor, ECF subfamily